MVFWELSPEVLESLWRMTTATCEREGGGVALAESLHGWEKKSVSLLNYTVAFALQLKKSTENLSHGNRVVKTALAAATWLSFERQPQVVC
jgi:hypothetical protein